MALSLIQKKYSEFMTLFLRDLTEGIERNTAHYRGV